MSLDKKARALALEELREQKFKDLEKIYDAMFAIATSEDSEDRDKVNAAKVAATMLGLARPAQERAPVAPIAPTTGPGSIAPKLDEAVEARIRAIIGK